MRANLPCEFDVNVHKAADPCLDAWSGAKLFMNDDNNKIHFITKQEYAEYGLDYFKEHFCSNLQTSSKRDGNVYYDSPIKKQKLN